MPEEKREELLRVEHLCQYFGKTKAVDDVSFNIYKGVKEAIDEKGFAGIFTGALSAASGGTTAALLFGFIASLFFKGKPK